MKSPSPLSPIHDALLAKAAAWRDSDSMPPSVRQFDDNDPQKAAVLGVADLSHLPRAGVKGPNAAGWLSGLGLPIPPRPNIWLDLPDGGLIGRLGNTEYLVDGSATPVAQIMQTPRASGVYPVLRQDAAFALCGSRVNELLLQTCNVDFRSLAANPEQLVLTSMAGVSILILATGNTIHPVYRLWCDGTYGHYLWETLTGIAEDLGGGCIGLDVLP
jgi:sarcosine oxidase, subunit gamma